MKGRAVVPGPVRDEAPAPRILWLLLYLLFFTLVFLPIFAG